MSVGSQQIRFRVDPRLVPANKAARRLGITAGNFREKLPELRRSGFPSPCPVTGNFDLAAIDRWIDRRSGFEAASVGPNVDTVIQQRLTLLG